MPANGKDVTTHMGRFVRMLDVAFRDYGRAGGLPVRLKRAVRAVPRHRFVHRFRVDDGPVCDFGDDPVRHLPTIYSDQVMGHVDAAGQNLPSSNSQPSYMLWLLHLLDLRPGQRVLEIGSGSGWLAAIMARLVGRDGQMTGIEIIPGLAEQSRADLLAMGLGNVTILAQDGTSGHQAGAPFDRVIITAATWDLPLALFEQAAESGLVLVPIKLRGGVGCQVTVLRHTGDRFVAERSIHGWFVPLVGAGQSRAGVRSALQELPFWSEIAEAPSLRCKFPIGESSLGASGAAGSQFLSFLGRTEQGLIVLHDQAEATQAGMPAGSFGLVDETERSVALCKPGALVGYGAPSAVQRLVRAYERWTELGLPGMAAFDLEVVRSGAGPEAGGDMWIEPRGGTALIWRLSAGIGRQ